MNQMYGSLLPFLIEVENCRDIDEDTFQLRYFILEVIKILLENSFARKVFLSQGLISFLLDYLDNNTAKNSKWSEKYLIHLRLQVISVLYQIVTLEPESIHLTQRFVVIILDALNLKGFEHLQTHLITLISNMCHSPSFCLELIRSDAVSLLLDLFQIPNVPLLTKRDAIQALAELMKSTEDVKISASKQLYELNAILVLLPYVMYSPKDKYLLSSLIVDLLGHIVMYDELALNLFFKSEGINYFNQILLSDASKSFKGQILSIVLNIIEKYPKETKSFFLQEALKSDKSNLFKVLIKLYEKEQNLANFSSKTFETFDSTYKNMDIEQLFALYDSTKKISLLETSSNFLKCKIYLIFKLFDFLPPTPLELFENVKLIEIQALPTIIHTFTFENAIDSHLSHLGYSMDDETRQYRIDFELAQCQLFEIGTEKSNPIYEDSESDEEDSDKPFVSVQKPDSVSVQTKKLITNPKSVRVSPLPLANMEIFGAFAEDLRKLRNDNLLTIMKLNSEKNALLADQMAAVRNFENKFYRKLMTDENDDANTRYSVSLETSRKLNTVRYLDGITGAHGVQAEDKETLDDTMAQTKPFNEEKYIFDLLEESLNINARNDSSAVKIQR
eukprot:TRINITY_DN7173_c0_g1_i1.p1 TRINITY_DN7173_c0_g1~~TRINITY_DN7173_c0_g1_i1.p1  ORF type:complete len:617 (+),score=185.11 TRINITY_DN7173_c0_g1_i1:1-1851(+)